jgi:hypothetical protein
MGNFGPKLLKLVELFKSYGLFGEPKVVDFLFFWKNVKKNDIFGPLTHKLKKLSPKAIFNVLNSVTFFSCNTYRCV